MPYEKSYVQKIIMSAECWRHGRGHRGSECATGQVIDAVHLKGVMWGLSTVLHLVTYLLNLFRKDGFGDFSGN